MKIDELREEVLSLPVDERAKLVDALLQSLNGPPDPEIERLWKEEIRRRVEGHRSGRVKPIPGDEVFARIWNRFKA